MGPDSLGIERTNNSKVIKLFFVLQQIRYSQMFDPWLGSFRLGNHNYGV